ncbi:MAG TPA: hypothetical protein PKN48_10170 [Bacteroidales bacterium]|nr:hypothetical protein [Bacteroidales bacterium]
MIKKNVKQKFVVTYHNVEEFVVTFNNVGEEQLTKFDEVGRTLGVKPTINPRTPEPPIITRKSPAKKLTAPAKTIKQPVKKTGK